MSVDNASPKDVCVGCSQEVEAKSGLLMPQCQCFYCPACLRNRVEYAFENPPRCCYEALSFRSAKTLLPARLVHQIQTNLLELTTKKRLHCHNPNCGVFVAPRHIHNSNGYCQKCLAVTCAKCREKEHFGRCSNTIEQLRQKYKFQQCPTCGHVVERFGGCNHMSCTCGSEECECIGDEHESEDKDE
ncbi:uncharacterized protein CLAFUR5_09164 [Fulvia fulva]|uniref:RBR-type E3 ubiquitin transferase n=1 Tax=Passalora fulva TaxID=5499 RepID=A0A9Q8PG64_PASFU|nr:uncharacterized protein CLAFUR5_09164 [Fulvia fulva]UJO21883.1 hypothetical protein CLAFUR5_09164 [Fulvia fulva]